MTTYLGKFAASAFRKLSSVYVFSYFPFGFEGRIWDLIVSVPDHCLSFYFPFFFFFFFVSIPLRSRAFLLRYVIIGVKPKGLYV